MQSIEILRFNDLFKSLSDVELSNLARNCSISELNQGKALIRYGKFETHAFLVLEGTLRLLSKEAFSDNLFTIGYANKNQIVGLTDFLRKDPSESAIARQPTKVLCIPMRN